ncbi:hypothetical protein E1B28_001972 [Marasmius oreades]|uniref:Uncharacterized protein n=1 Tax=Marasmius oreades TaxID=181124 RepID=A0A9P7V4G4_9AGAR|nr:uncharacterized protein E1B28_001972 [Marasmius oreades]KAG7100195.1 hypothetical protein E1B28_001972 [Marasmius oreades]
MCPEFQLSILTTLNLIREGKDDILSTIADMALEISGYRSISRIRPLVVTSCETVYSANFYTKYFSQSDQDCYPERQSLGAKLARLTETLDDIRLLSNRIASRGRLSATLVERIGFWESNKIQKLQNILKAMIIHDFWPEDQKMFNTQRNIEETKVQAQAPIRVECAQKIR